MATAAGTYRIDVLKSVGKVMPNMKYAAAKQIHRTLPDMPRWERVRQNALRAIMNKKMVRSNPTRPFAEA